MSPDNHFGIFAVIMSLSGAAFLLQGTRIGAQITGTVIVILGAIFAANVGFIPHQAPAYDFVFTFIVPILIPLFLLQADLRRVIHEASRTTMAFIIASAGTVLGVLLAVSVLDLSHLATQTDISATDKDGAIAGLFAATYIGGSVNYAALGEMTGLTTDRSFFSAATAADNLFSAVYLSFIASLPAVSWLARWYPEHPSHQTAQTEATPAVTAQSLCLALAIAITLVVISDAVAAALTGPSGRYIILTTLTLALATLLPQVRGFTAGGFELGIALSFAFFASIAAGADIEAMVSKAPILGALVGILLTVHLGVLLFVGRLCRLTLPELLTASNAAILGATTAPTMAAAKGWHDQVTPGVLVGVIGYALGTFIGGAVFQLW
ncbi:MAG: DUF819 family protein [Luminiphilus sp.]|nr:DUF819 family protein [Luminiphilus sp.]